MFESAIRSNTTSIGVKKARFSGLKQHRLPYTPVHDA